MPRPAALAGHKRLLLALDNVEPGLNADALLDTLSVRGHTALLLTARQRVAPHRLRAIDLPPLPPPDGASLFSERLNQINAARPDAQDEPVIPHLLAALGGLPLALELTAADAGMQRLGLVRVLREVEQDGLHALALRADPNRALLTRFGRSWAALVPRQQRLFAGLSLLALANATDEQPDPPGDLLTLVNYALVEALPGGERLHPLLREYAADKLTTLPTRTKARLGDALVAFWLAYAQAHPGYDGMNALEAEAGGLMGALAWAHEAGRHEAVCGLARALGRAWNVRGRREEYLRMNGWMEEAARQSQNLSDQRWAAHHLALAHWQVGRLEEARAGYERALALARQLSDPDARR